MTADFRARSKAGPFLKPRQGLPLSRPLDIDSVPDDGLALDWEASNAECAAIALEAGLPAVEALKAKLRVERRASGRFEVTGDLTARITQVCVVTLEPFESDVAQPIDIVFARAAPPPPERPGTRHRQSAAAVSTSAPPPEVDVDAPDPIVDGTIDLGMVVFEFLMLARDLYPRKPGVEFTDVVGGESDPEPSAFAALQRLKDRS